MNKMVLEGVRCNLCTNDETNFLFQIEGLNIVRCKECGLIYVNPRPKAESIYQIYDEKYFIHKNDCFTNQYFGYYDYISDKKKIEKSFIRRLDVIEKYCNYGRLLDVGCASGYFLLAANKRGWDVHGIDVSAFAVAIAKREFGENRIMKGTLKEIKFPENSFDVVTFWDVLEHLPDPISNLKEAYGILKPGGIIGIVVPDAGSLASHILGKYWPEFKRIREHIYFFNKKTITTMLEKVGFKVLYIEGAGRIFNIVGLLNECKIYNYFIFDKLSKIANAIGLSKINLYIKPGYKIAVYARKI